MSWNKLSMRERADIMKLAIDNGIYNLNTIRGAYNEYAEGGSIHIKPSHRGRLTELKARTGKSEAELYNDGNPAHKKMVVFARNARKWKHGLGGHIFDGTSEPTQFMEEDRFATTQMPQLLVTAKRKYVAGYDENGNPIYTENPQESMGYTPYTRERTKYQEWANRDKNAPKYTNAFVRAAQGLIGAPLTTIAGAASQKALGGNLYSGEDNHTQQINPMPWQTTDISDEEAQLLEWERHPLGHNLEEIAITAKMPEHLKSTPKYSEILSEFVQTLENATSESFSPQIYQTEELVVPYASSKPIPKTYRTLNLDNTLFNNEYLTSDQFEKDIQSKFLNMDKEQVMAVQANLAAQGFYDLNSDNMTEKEIKNIQSKLYDKGFLKGDRKNAIDGIIGPKTIEAWRKYNIDGKPGTRTLNAFKAQYSPKERWWNNVSTDNTEWCAEWVSKKVKNASGDLFGVSGDAWTMPQNIVNSGGEMLYNIYNNDSFSNISNVSDLKRTTEESIKENPFDISQLQLGDIVGIYMPSSDMHAVALSDGTTYNTHVGVVTGFDKDGTPIIEHNIHKKHHKDRANHLTGSMTGSPKIATVTRPAYPNATIPTLYTENVQSQYTTEDDNPLFSEYANSIAGSKDVMGKIFPNANMDDVELATLAVQGRETNFMNRRGSTLTGKDKVKYELRKAYRDKYKKADPETVSSDLSKMKLSSFSPNERQLLGIQKPEDLNNPTLAGRAALYLMTKNYDYFKRLSDIYPELGLTGDDLRYLTELSYNQGMKILSSIGFKENGEIDLSEIEKIRSMADENARVKDISSTNYKYLGTVGQFLYDKFGNAHIPYISAAERNRKKLLAKTKSKNDLLTLNK